MIALPTLNFSSTPCVPLDWEDVQAVLWHGHGRPVRPGLLTALVSGFDGDLLCSGLTC